MTDAHDPRLAKERDRVIAVSQMTGSLQPDALHYDLDALIEAALVLGAEPLRAALTLAEKKLRDIEETDGHRTYMRGYNAANKERAALWEQGVAYGKEVAARAALAATGKEETG